MTLEVFAQDAKPGTKSTAKATKTKEPKEKKEKTPKAKPATGLKLKVKERVAKPKKAKKAKAKKEVKRDADGNVIKRRMKPGRRALVDIRKAQKSDKIVLLRAPMKRLFQEIMHDVGPTDLRISAKAIDVLLEIAQNQGTQVFNLANSLVCDLTKKVTVDDNAFRMASNLMLKPHMYHESGIANGSLLGRT